MVDRSRVPDELTLESYGGEVGLWERATSTPDDEMPRLIEVLTDNWPLLTDQRRAEEIVLSYLTRTPSPNALGETIDAVLGSEPAAEALGGQVATILLDRAHDRSSGQAADLAARALEGAVRLALAELVSDAERYAMLAQLLRIEGDSPLYGTRVSRLLSIAYEHWSVEGARDALTRLIEVPGVEGDAAFSMAMIEIADALGAETEDELLAQLAGARTWLDRARRWDEERSDAELYLIAIEGVLGFATKSPVDEQRTLAGRIGELLTQRHLDHLGMRPTWASARLDAEQEWWRLVDLLVSAHEPLEEESWITPVETAVQVLAAYRASRTIRPAFGRGHEGVYQAVAPRFRSAFIQHAGLRRHLSDAVRLDLLPGTTSEAARALLAETEDTRSPPDSDPDIRYPLLMRAIGRGVDNGQLTDFAAGSSGVLDALEGYLADRQRHDAQAGVPQVEVVHQRVSSALSGCDDYQGTGAIEVDELLLELLHFLWSRMTVQRDALSRLAYLEPFALETPPHEREMARDLYEYLGPNLRRARPQMEVRDIAGGRVDVLVSYGQSQYVIECKRELGSASPETIDAYVPQVAQYQATARLVAFLMVLDLGRSGPLPVYRECVWTREMVSVQDRGLSRRIVVIRVPGNQAQPSSLR